MNGLQIRWFSGWGHGKTAIDARGNAAQDEDVRFITLKDEHAVHFCIAVTNGAHRAVRRGERSKPGLADSRQLVHASASETAATGSGAFVPARLSRSPAAAAEAPAVAVDSRLLFHCPKRPSAGTRTSSHPVIR